MKNIILTSIFALVSFGATLYAQNPCGDGTIIINGQDVDAVSFDNNNKHGFNLPLWLIAGSSIATGNRVQLISVIEFNEEVQSGGGYTLVYNGVINVGSVTQTVPSGKVWKVEAVVKHSDPFISGISANSNSPICFNDNLNLTSLNISGATYSWTGPNGFTSSAQNPTINNTNFTNAGTYHLTTTHNGCSYTDSVNVIIRPNPASTFSNTYATEGYNTTFSPDDTGLTYQWAFDNGVPTTSNAEFPNVQWGTAGNYNVDLTVTNTHGCSSTTQQSVTVNNCLVGQSQSDFNWGVAVAGYTTAFTPDLGGETYYWEFDQGSPATSTAENPLATWSNPGTYTVKLTVSTSSGCYTTTQSVTVSNCQIGQSQSNFVWSTPGAGYNTLFTPDVSGATYSWTFDQGTPANSAAENPIAVWANPGTYSVTLTVSTGGTCYTTTQSVTVSNCHIGLPQSNFTWSFTNDGTSGETFTFNPINPTADSYTWTLDQGSTPTSTNQNPTTTWSNAGSYDVTLVTSWNGVGCYSTTQQVSVFTGALTFTNCGQTGRTGPDQIACDVAYSGTGLAGLVTVTNGLQEWEVPATKDYIIHAVGAQGGGSPGGYPASMSGKFSLTAGHKIQILVGQQGVSSGGGSFVENTTTSTLLIAAGGGGGKGTSTSGSGTKDALPSENGQGSGSGTGGTNGSGGTAGGSSSARGGGGGGYSGDGSSNSSYAIFGGKSFTTGGEGGNGSGGYHGGFGGGGGSSSSGAGGGGGGYSGGAGGQTSTYYGGGGGSYNSGTNKINVATTLTGHGEVVIYY